MKQYALIWRAERKGKTPVQGADKMTERGLHIPELRPESVPPRVLTGRNKMKPIVAIFFAQIASDRQ
jgi:hypothetical protein